MPKFNFGSLLEKKSQEEISPEPERLDEEPKIELREYAIDTEKETFNIEEYIRSPSNIKFMNFSEDFFKEHIRKPIPEMIDVLIDKLKIMKKTLIKKGNLYYYKIQE